MFVAINGISVSYGYVNLWMTAIQHEFYDEFS